MEDLINGFKALPLWKKIIFIAAIPLVIAALCFFGTGAVQSLLDSHARKEADDKSAALDQKIQTDTSKVNIEEGKASQLEDDKNEAVKATENDDPTRFYNDRFDPNNKQ